jgi:hypothetical protein
MFRRHLLRTAVAGSLLAASLAVSSACADTSGRLYVRIGPPVPVYEVRVVAPGPEYVWIDGYHRWDGRAYVWVGGRWERPPRPRAVWERGHWDHNNRGYFWVEGRWHH